jgi:hypothetical protein
MIRLCALQTGYPHKLVIETAGSNSNSRPYGYGTAPAQIERGVVDRGTQREEGREGMTQRGEQTGEYGRQYDHDGGGYGGRTRRRRRRRRRPPHLAVSVGKKTGLPMAWA